MYPKTIEFLLPMDPEAQQRHRDGELVKKADGKTFTRKYDPSKKSKTDFRMTCLSLVPKTLLDGPLQMECRFIFPRPKHHYVAGDRSRPLKANAPDWVEKKPDLDNLIKFIKDALKGFYFHDDAQIARYGEMEKLYGEEPSIKIKISQIYRQC